MAVKELNAKEYEKSVEESYSSAESTLPFSNPPINNCLSSLNDRAVIKPAVKHDTNAEINYGSEGAISEEEISLTNHEKLEDDAVATSVEGSKSTSSPPEQQPARSYSQPQSIGGNTQGEEVRKHSLQFPDYSDEAVRLQSFKHWGGVLPAQELAEGGYYMIARCDVVRCFSCNVVVQDWKRSDNVIDEHNPNCSFLYKFVSSKGVDSSAGKLRTECPSSSGSREASRKQVVLSGMTSEPLEDFKTDESCEPPASDLQVDGAVFTSDEIVISASDTGSIDSEQFIPSQSTGPNPAGVQSSDEEENWVEGLTPCCEAVTPVTICDECSMTIFDCCQSCPIRERPISKIIYLPIC